MGVDLQPQPTQTVAVNKMSLDDRSKYNLVNI